MWGEGGSQQTNEQRAILNKPLLKGRRYKPACEILVLVPQTTNKSWRNLHNFADLTEPLLFAYTKF